MTKVSNILIEVSAPCRLDMGGTLDIKTFHRLFNNKSVSTFNIALDLRTKVTIEKYEPNKIKISSQGFEAVEFFTDKVNDKLNYNKPLGLMFAIADHFKIKGIHIKINSASPPKSGLGGSSAATVALTYGLSQINDNAKPLSLYDTLLLAHKIEENILGVPCGLQDHLAAGYGGINLWQWSKNENEPPFIRQQIIKKEKDFAEHILAAYSGAQHESKNINSKWIKDYLSNKTTNTWRKIAVLTLEFAAALSIGDFKQAAQIMNTETALRREITDGLFNDTGEKLAAAAIEHDCGARFTGAGGGGCIWALGEKENIAKLKTEWKYPLENINNACMLETNIANRGVLTHVSYSLR